MRRAHVAGMPPDQHEILARSVDRAVHCGRFRHSGRKVVEWPPRNLIRPLDDGHCRIDAGGFAEFHTERHRRHRDQGSGDQIASARFEYFHSLCSLDDLSLVAPRRGVKEAGPKNFVMSLVAEIPNLCCERARPNVAHGEPNPDADNGFVMMLFLLIPALTALILLALSWWIADLHFSVSWMFYVGLFVVSTSLLFFSLKSWGQPARQ